MIGPADCSRLLNETAASRPGLWRDLEDQVITEHGAGRQSRFLSGARWLSLAPQGLDGTGEVLWVANTMPLATWRYTQRIYAIEPGLRADLIATPLTGVVPLAVFDQLPDYAICLDLDDAGISHLGRPVRAAWLCPFNAKVEGERGEIVDEAGLVMTCLLAGTDPIVTTHMLPIGPGESIATAADRTLERGVTAETDAELATSGPRIHGRRRDERLQETRTLWTMVLPLALALCVEQPIVESDDRIPPARLQIKTTRRHGTRLFAPAAPRVIHVGLGYVGAHARRTRSGEPRTTGRGVQPHVRRGHWHLYWLGPRDGVQTPHVRWIAPTVVGVRD